MRLFITIILLLSLVQAQQFSILYPVPESNVAKLSGSEWPSVRPLAKLYYRGLLFDAPADWQYGTNTEVSPFPCSAQLNAPYVGKGTLGNEKSVTLAFLYGTSQVSMTIARYCSPTCSDLNIADILMTDMNGNQSTYRLQGQKSENGQWLVLRFQLQGLAKLNRITITSSDPNTCILDSIEYDSLPI